MAGLLEQTPKQPGLLGNSPVNYKGTLSDLGSIGMPSFETKTSTQAVPDKNTIGIPIEALNPVPIAQGIARTVGNVGITAGNIPTQIVNKVAGLLGRAPQPLPFDQTIPTDQNPITKAVFGGVPLATLQEQTKNLQPGAGIAAAPLVLGNVVLDLAGLGGESGAAKAIIKATTEETAMKILTKAGAPEDVAKMFAPRAVAVSTPEEAKALLGDIKNFKTTTEPLASGLSSGAEQIAKEMPKPSLAEQVLKESPQDTSLAADSGINVRNLLISPEGKSLVTQTVKEIKPLIEAKVGTTLTNKEVLDFARQSSKMMEQAIGREQTLHYISANLKARQALSAMAETGVASEEFIRNLVVVKSIGTDAGRILQAQSIGAEAKAPLHAIMNALLDAGVNIDELIKASKGVDFNNLKQATEFYRRWIKPKMSEWIDLLRYNSMLSSPLTHMINIVSNLLNTSFIAPLEKALTGGLDFLGSKITGGPRTAFAGEGVEYYKHYLLNVKKAFKDLTDVMTGKRMYTNLDTRSIPIATKGVKGKIVSVLAFPSRALEGMDQFFMALGEGGERGALQYRASKGVAVPNMEEKVQREALYRLYRTKPLEEQQGYLLDAVDQFTTLVQQARNSKNPIVANIAKFVVPFLQTPMNILKQGIEFSPLGFGTIPGAANKTEQLSRAILGSAVFTGAATLLASNRLTFAEPTDANGKRDFRAAGMQPYSIKIGDTWYSYQKLPPAFSFPFVMVASINQAVQEKKMDEGTMNMILSTIAKYGQFMSDQSYVKSIGDIVSSFSGGEAGVANVISNFAQQMIPFRAFGGWLARMTDPVQRKIDSNGTLLEKQIQLLMMNVPGLIEMVPARLDAQGNPIPNPNPIGNAISPVKTTKQTEADLVKYDALQAYKKEKQTASELNKKEKDAMQPTYDKAHELLRAGDTAGARAIVDGLTDDEYKIYSQIRNAEHSANTTFLRTMIHSSPTDAVKFLRSQLPDEKSRLLNVMTDEEYKIYEAAKKAFDENPVSVTGTANDLAFMNLVPAVPRNDGEQKIIDDATKHGFFMTRDPNGELNARHNYPPGWDAEKAYLRAHDAGGTARLASIAQWLTGAEFAKAAEEAAPGSMVSQPRSFLDYLLGKSEIVRMPNESVMGRAVTPDVIKNAFVGVENGAAQAMGKDLYSIVGVTGDLGKYQVSSSTVSSWSKSWLGKKYTKDEFLADPKAQEEFFSQFLKVAKRYNLDLPEMAIAWHAGWGELGTGPSDTREARFRAKLDKLMQTPENQAYVDKFMSIING